MKTKPITATSAQPDYKAMAVKLLTASSAVPHGSKWLADAAGISNPALALVLLKKLREAGKVAFTDGKWTRA